MDAPGRRPQHLELHLLRRQPRPSQVLPPYLDDPERPQRVRPARGLRGVGADVVLRCDTEPSALPRLDQDGRQARPGQPQRRHRRSPIQPRQRRGVGRPGCVRSCRARAHLRHVHEGRCHAPARPRGDLLRGQGEDRGGRSEGRRQDPPRARRPHGDHRPRDRDPVAPPRWLDQPVRGSSARGACRRSARRLHDRPHVRPRPRWILCLGERAERPRADGRTLPPGGLCVALQGDLPRHGHRGPPELQAPGCGPDPPPDAVARPGSQLRVHPPEGGPRGKPGDPGHRRQRE